MKSQTMTLFTISTGIAITKLNPVKTQLFLIYMFARNIGGMDMQENCFNTLSVR